MTTRQFWALCLCLWLSIPLLSAVPLPVPLRHHYSCHDRHHDSHCDHKHRDCFRQAELTVNPRQRWPGQLRRVPTGHVAIVVDVEVADVEDLAEDAVKVAVTVPGVAWWSMGRGRTGTVYRILCWFHTRENYIYFEMLKKIEQQTFI